MPNPLLCLLLPLLLVLSPLVGQAQQAGFQPDENAWYGLVARGSGRSLDITGSSAEAGVPAVQWEFTHAPSQQWRFVRAAAGSEYYRIEAKSSGKCLTVEKPDENAVITQRPWTGGFYQQWKLVPAGPAGSWQLVSRGNDKCAAVAASDKFNGTPIVAQRPMNRATQQWRLFKLHLNLDASQTGFGPAEPLKALNTPGNELQPVLAPDGKTLYLARTKFAGNTEGSTDSGDIWVSQSADEGQTWGPASRLDALNTQQNNGVMAVLGPSGSHLLVRGTYDRDGGFRDDGVSRVARAGGAKSKSGRPEALTIRNYYSAAAATTFFQSADEKILLLSLERGDSFGGNDLYVSFPAADGTWTEPRNLGGVLNSPGFEFAPWLDPDGKTLYFSSYGHAGYGSSDIFVSTRLDDSWTAWSEPRNLGPSLNTAGFDAYFMLSPDGKQAYYAAARTPNGPADLYRATASGVAPPDTVPPPVVPNVAQRALFTGQVLDAKTRLPVVAEVKAIRMGNDIAFNATSRTDATGRFQFTLPQGPYRLAVAGKGYLTATDTVRMVGTLTRELLLVPAAVGASLDLPTLIFAQGKASLLPASYAELNRLARTLTDNPAVNIRLEGHTDNQGRAELNQQLSEDRVAEVRRYLVTRGVAEGRISTIGFGGTKPRASNAKEETRKLNRRVEFTITK
ncbi:WD40-like Beta Propeller Repeat [Hymenobacter daecheongensis DSM 21074]|uniref:WD40-like Beta Propeller Repeat n=1 Tax=Hymenobacter daecheongensis DSM 21074 TaxID=1121955 RepID=A0A1M6MCW0_9BACT|nr:RICIN domain-containing protein [Hymenobacter daecheongensis]SHJ81285.1 WD40-like Beta Propeller Repeat [Hymenobacter daecheongensis DSM 21074]